MSELKPGRVRRAVGRFLWLALGWVERGEVTWRQEKRPYVPTGNPAAENAVARALIDWWPPSLPGPIFSTRYRIAAAVVRELGLDKGDTRG